MLNYKDTGTGFPVLLIHGLFGNLDNLAGLGRALLDAHFRVIQVDVRNHGESPTYASMSYDDMAQDIVSLLDHLNIAECHLVGHSMGGKIAMRVALRQPQRIKALGVADIAPVPYQSHHVNVLKGLDELERKPTASRKEADTLLAEFIAEAGVRQFLLKNLRWTNGRAEWRLRYPEVKQEYDAIIGWNRIDAQFCQPTLFIKGNDSDYITAEYREEIAKYFPTSKAKIIQGTGHWLHAEKPEAFNRIVLQFLTGVG
ncbi:alpha/beta fold hydrolase [Echinimonas agarilytica]|uniref:Alpha/beta fold hydrolase n=1 Tax=Echinimonas agarilytica TaxID=1215918 RepID=A0AA41W8Y8_9GAMM|nr:alpha/beta fold hydrolase [Echinimonas agarilytica]MCM2680793.1 alpha/beta fold hydrolase [Echinimonas agarilytica]